MNYPQATIVIRAYSDDQGDAIAAREYTLAQANALSHYLQSALPQEYRWITVGGGQSQPVAPPNSATDSAADSAAADDIAINRQRNRRLEILVDTR
ncbi:MAG: hypothetical protein HC800_17575 [Phormidesmis sp. RL_2_1]|nr:hypothetical protein [Phormidesmis sp. RL_2_1]